MRERLRVLRVVIGLNQGGVQQGVLNLFRGLDRQRFEPIACAIENSGAIGQEIEAEGFEVINLGHRRQPARTVRTLARLMRERAIDIVDASSYHPSLYARTAAVLAGVPVRISHEHVVFDRVRPQRILVNRLLGPFTDAYVAVGAAVGRQVMESYGYPRSKVHVIHNGVDAARFRPPDSREEAKRNLGLQGDVPVIGIVARLDPEKGHRFLFEALARLRGRFRVRCLVVGTGRGEARVREEAGEHSVGDLVEMLGLRRDVPRLLQAFDVFAFPTLQEGFPNALLEAMAAGCAIAASDFEGNLELVRDGETALVTPMGDAAALAGALERLLGDEGLRRRLGEAARARVLAEFSIDRMAQRTAALYETLWQRKAGRRG